jgi:glycine/D-amino acid oxidase-like deaminating enzyme
MKYYDADVVVVGGGIVGAFTALRLAQKNRAVYLIDKGDIGRESTGRCGGGVRQQYRDPAELPLAMKAVDIWAGLEEEFGEPLEYRRQGSLKLLENDDDLAEAQARIQREQASGLDVVLLSRQEVFDYAPQIGSDAAFVGGTLCVTDGTANPLLLARALGPALDNAGVRVTTQERVRRFETMGSRVISAITDLAEYRAETFVNAAGAWAADLCSSLGLHFPCTVHKSQLLITEPMSPIIRGFISFKNGYIRQAVDGNLHLGIRGIPIDVLEKSLTYHALIDAGRYYPKIFPFIRNINIIRGFSGFTTWSPDGIPIIDKAPGLDGFYLAGGFSGHGFCLGPMVGQLLADWICDGSSALDLSKFSWSRFSKIKIDLKTQTTRVEND